MSYLIPFEESVEAKELLSKGYSVTVVFDPSDVDTLTQKNLYAQLGFDIHSKDRNRVKHVTILSEIGNMPGHYVVVGKHGTIVCGLHGDWFYYEQEDD